MANGDPVAEARAVLDKYQHVRTSMPTIYDALSALLTYTRSLLEPLGDEGRELVERMSVRWEKMDGAAAPKINRILTERKEAAAYIERQAAALSVRDDLPALMFMDELEAVQAGAAWIEPIAERLYKKGPTSLDRQLFGNMGGTGGVIICWHGIKLAAVVTIFRDEKNWSRVLRWISPETRALLGEQP